MRWASLGIMLVGFTLLVGPASATQVFHLGEKEALGLAPTTAFTEVVGHTTASLYCVGGVNCGSAAFHQYKLAHNASVLPVWSNFTLEVTQATVMPVAGSGGFGQCPFMVYVGVASGDSVKYYWYYCAFPKALADAAVMQPGTYPLDLDWGTSIKPFDAKAGDFVYTSIWTDSSSTAAAPSLKVKGGEGLSTLTLDGTNEPLVLANGTVVEAGPTAPPPAPGSPPGSPPAPPGSPPATPPGSPPVSPSESPPGTDAPSQEKQSAGAGFVLVLGATVAAVFVARSRR